MKKQKQEYSANPYFQSMIETELDLLNNSRDVFKDSRMKVVKNFNFNISGTNLIGQVSLKSGEVVDCLICHDHPQEVGLTYEDIDAYFDSDSYLKQFQDEFPVHIPYDILTSKMPEVLEQLVLLRLFKKIEEEGLLSEKMYRAIVNS